MIFLIIYLSFLLILTFSKYFFVSRREVESLSIPRSSKWRKIRNFHLNSNPFCAICGSTDNLSVHHIKSFSENPELELAPDNLITLCENKNLNCHFVFGHHMRWTNLNDDLLKNIGKIILFVKGRKS